MISGLTGRGHFPAFTDKRARRQAVQFACALFLALLGGLLWFNLTANLGAAGMQVDFGFLWQDSGFDLNETVIAHGPGASYLNALLAGFLNTLKLTAVCIALATFVGFAIGFASLSAHPILKNAALAYVGAMRNLPKLLILLAVYVVMVRELPGVRDAWAFGGFVFVSNRGIEVPAVVLAGGWSGWAIVAAGVIAAVLGWRAVAQRGHPNAGALIAVLMVAAAVALTRPQLSLPALQGFNFSGGWTVTVPFLALMIALGAYHGAQIGELVRAAILAVPAGQREAGSALGLGRMAIMLLIVVPQALRLMVPPLTNQYINTLKNTSIGLAVGYSDLVSVMSTAVNQTFRPIELMIVTMCVYLSVGLAVSGALAFFGSRADGR